MYYCPFKFLDKINLFMFSYFLYFPLMIAERRLWELGGEERNADIVAGRCTDSRNE